MKKFKNTESAQLCSELGQNTFPPVGIVDRLAVPAVAAADVKLPAQLEHPEAEGGLEDVVGPHDVLDVVGPPALHEPGPGHLDDVHVEAAQEDGRPSGAHQQPVVDAGVPGRERGGGGRILL